MTNQQPGRIQPTPADDDRTIAQREPGESDGPEGLPEDEDEKEDEEEEQEDGEDDDGDGDVAPGTPRSGQLPPQTVRA